MMERVSTRALTHWHPFRELSRLEEVADSFFGDGLRWLDWPVYHWHHVMPAEREFRPPLEILERDGQTVIRLEVPGVKPEDIDLSVADGVLTIKGEKKAEEEIKKEDCCCSDRWYGSFRRMVSVPQGLDESQISATCRNGVLEVVLPKVEERKPHMVKVEAK